MSIAQIRSWDPDSFGAAGAAASARAADIDGAMTAADAAMSSIEDWTGPSADAARTAFSTKLEQGRELRNLLLCIADDAADAEREVGCARTFLLSLINAITSGTVDDDGTVTDADGELAPGQTAQIRAALRDVYRQDVLFGAALADSAQALRAVAREPAQVVAPDGTITDAPTAIAQLSSLSIDDRQQYFGTLPPVAQRALLAADPESIGNTDGVPFPLRIAANDVNIRNARDAELRKAPDKRDQALINRYTAMVDEPIGEPNGSDHRSPNDNTTERQFIAFDPRGQGRWIEQVGRITPAARGVGVYVPGTGTNLAGSDANLRSARNLAQRSGAAMFLYGNGDLPDKIVPDATSPTYALAMAPGLVDFGHALDNEIARAAPGLKTTYVGHSYGGVVVGHAEELGLRADRVLYASSPATGVQPSHPWTNPAPDVARYSLTAPGDLIQEVQELHLFDGNDPDDHPGIKRLDTGYFGDGTLVEGVHAHGNYWNDPDSDAFKNMARVIGGDEPTPYVHRRGDTIAAEAVESTERQFEEGWKLPNLIRLGHP